jgi:hypothetical protein
MSVTVNDVRYCLNNASEEDIAELTIVDKIHDAEGWAEEVGIDPDDDGSGEKAVKYYAAWLSYMVSNTYIMASAGPISVREAFEEKSKFLRDQAEAWLGKALGTSTVVTKKIPLLRKYTSSEQEKDPDIVFLKVK